MQIRSDPTLFLLDSHQSESDLDFVGRCRKHNEFRSDLVGIYPVSDTFRQNPGRNPTDRNPTKTVTDPIDII